MLRYVMIYIVMIYIIEMHNGCKKNYIAEAKQIVK